MTDQEILQLLIAQAMPPEVIMRIMELMTEEKFILARRTRDAERKRVYRASLSADVRGCPTLSQDTNSAYISKKESKKKEIKQTPIFSDWSISDEGRVFAASKGFSPERIASEADRFRDHALAHGRKCRDWEAAWRNWVTSPFQTANGNGRATPAPRPGSKEDRHERTANALRQLDAFIAGNGNDPRGSGPSGETDFGVIPFVKPPRP